MCSAYYILASNPLVIFMLLQWHHTYRNLCTYAMQVVQHFNSIRMNQMICRYIIFFSCILFVFILVSFLVLWLFASTSSTLFEISANQTSTYHRQYHKVFRPLIQNCGINFCDSFSIFNVFYQANMKTWKHKNIALTETLFVRFCRILKLIIFLN